MQALGGSKEDIEEANRKTNSYKAAVEGGKLELKILEAYGWVSGLGELVELGLSVRGLVALVKGGPSGALTLGEKIGILREAASGAKMVAEREISNPNFTVGKATRKEVEELGAAFVGPDARWSSDGSTLLSADGLRAYRPPTPKPNSPFATTGVQANFETRLTPSGKYTANAHIDIKD